MQERVKPSGNCSLIDLAGGNCHHHLDRLVCGNTEVVSIEGAEHGRRLPAKALVPVDKGMVAGIVSRGVV